MVLGNPCSLTISSKYILATFDASDVWQQDKKWTIFENLSTTIRIESCFLAVLGNPKIKSILTSCQGQSGIGKGVYKPVFCFLCLATAHVLRWATIRATSLFKLGQKNWAFTNSIVLFLPKCPTNLPACNFQTKKSLKDVRGIHNLVSLNR